MFSFKKKKKEVKIRANDKTKETKTRKQNEKHMKNMGIILHWPISSERESCLGM